MTASDTNNRNCDGRSAGAARPEQCVTAAACALLTHPLVLPEENEAADKLRAMGVAAPTGADGLLLGQYLMALGGDTSAAKFVRDAALSVPPPEDAAPAALTGDVLQQLPDAALYAMAAGEERP